MTWTTVRSPGDVGGYRYAEDTKTLDVRFRDDTEFRYFNVHPSVVNHFKRASVKKDALDQSIRKHYKSRQVWPPEMHSSNAYDRETPPMTIEQRAEWTKDRQERERRMRGVNTADIPGY